MEMVEGLLSRPSCSRTAVKLAGVRVPVEAGSSTRKDSRRLESRAGGMECGLKVWLRGGGLDWEGMKLGLEVEVEGAKMGALIVETVEAVVVLGAVGRRFAWLGAADELAGPSSWGGRSRRSSGRERVGVSSRLARDGSTTGRVGVASRSVVRETRREGDVCGVIDASRKRVGEACGVVTAASRSSGSWS